MSTNTIQSIKDGQVTKTTDSTIEPQKKDTQDMITNDMTDNAQTAALKAQLKADIAAYSSELQQLQNKLYQKMITNDATCNAEIAAINAQIAVIEEKKNADPKLTARISEKTRLQLQLKRARDELKALQRGENDKTIKDLTDIEKELTEKIKIEPDNGDAYFQRARFYYETLEEDLQEDESTADAFPFPGTD